MAALLLGALAILATPREEEPQIVVPMLNVFVHMPGASSQEVAQRVSPPRCDQGGECFGCRYRAAK